MNIAPPPGVVRTRPGHGSVAPLPVPELDPVGVPTGADRPVALAALTSAMGTLVGVSVAVGVSTVLAYQVTIRNGALVHNRMLPWILGRSLGLASYLTLTAAVSLGIWIRHPWRNQLWSPRPESLLRAHVVAVAGTVVLLAGHLVSIALDRYAGVGWAGVFVPWHASYRPTAVAFGTLGFYGIVLVGGTAALAGWIGRRVWFPIHSVSASVFCLCLVHGAMAGSDSHSLRWVYVATGGMVAAALSTRWMARQIGRASLELE
jgi:sulfoxide reductase heme-binding subunit YedZ